MKKTLLVICLLNVFVTKSQTGAINIDFETADYTGWQLSSGSNNNSVMPLNGLVTATGGPLNIPASNCTVTTSQSIMTGTANVDPVCLQSLNSPLGGNYTARLNRRCGNMAGSILEQTFLVDNSNYILNIAYMVVLESAMHTMTDQPYFTYDVFDSTGASIPGAYYSTLTSSFTAPPGFTTTASGPEYYKPWTLDTIDLSAYVGHNVTLRFIAASCIQGGHSGYAYIDANLTSLITSIAQKNNETLIIYPNPANDLLVLSYSESDDFNYEVLDIFGQVVIKNQPCRNQKIDVSNLKKGTYILKGNLKNTLVTKKFIKE